MASNGRLLEPESLGTNGYVWCSEFDPALLEVRPNHPRILIDPVIWLKHTLSYFGVQEVTKESYQVDNGKAWQGHVRFTIPVRKDTGRPLQLSAVGIKAVNQSLAYKYAVVQSVNLLAFVGYNLPSYSSMIVQAIDEQGLLYDVENHCLLMAQNNTSNLVEATDMTHAGCSFEATLNQVMHKCGYDWKYAYASPMLTTEGYQDKLVATKKGSAAAPSFIVVSRPCHRPAEAMESALCTALTYISDTCGYIDDLDYAQLIIRRAQLLD